MSDVKKYYSADITSLSSDELEAHINCLKKWRLNAKGNSSMSVSETQMLLLMAISERNARGSSLLAKIAIYIAVASVMVSAASFAVSAFAN